METIRFYRVNDPYGCFSNFAPYEIEMEGTRWPTSEHYFQAQKFESAEAKKEIREDSSPMNAARRGRNRKWPLRPDWEQVKDQVMYEAVKAKFTQHADLKENILSTGDSTIIEHTDNDRYWADGGDGSGKNMLGQILMRVREELRKE